MFQRFQKYVTRKLQTSKQLSSIHLLLWSHSPRRQRKKESRKWQTHHVIVLHSMWPLAKHLKYFLIEIVTSYIMMMDAYCIILVQNISSCSNELRRCIHIIYGSVCFMPKLKKINKCEEEKKKLCKPTESKRIRWKYVCCCCSNL